MAEATDPVSKKESRLGGLSLICLAVGVLGPFLSPLAVDIGWRSRPFAGADPVAAAVGFRVLFLLLALLLGLFSRRSRAGRVGLFGSAVLLAVGLLVVLFLVFRPAAPAAHSAPSLPSPP